MIYYRIPMEFLSKNEKLIYDLNYLSIAVIDCSLDNEQWHLIYFKLFGFNKITDRWFKHRKNRGYIDDDNIEIDKQIESLKTKESPLEKFKVEIESGIILTFDPIIISVTPLFIE